MKISKFVKILFKNASKYLLGKQKFVVDFDGTKFIIYPRSDHLTVLKDVYVTELYKPSKPKDSYPVIVDVGAYMGDFTLWADKNLHPNLIIAIEPNKIMFDLLIKNIEINKIESKVIPIETALLDGKEASINVSKVIMSGTTVYPDVEKGKIKTISLKALMEKNKISKIDYFKMDIEGGERYILTECNKKLFNKYINYVSMETHTVDGFSRRDVKKYFEEIDFSINELKLFNGNTQLEAYNNAM